MTVSLLERFDFIVVVPYHLPLDGGIIVMVRYQFRRCHRCERHKFLVVVRMLPFSPFPKDSRDKDLAITATNSVDGVVWMVVDLCHLDIQAPLVFCVVC